MYTEYKNGSLSEYPFGHVWSSILEERWRIIGSLLVCILMAGVYEQFVEKTYPIRGSIGFHTSYQMENL